MLVPRHRLAIREVTTAVSASQLAPSQWIALAASARVSVSRTAMHQGDGDVRQC